MKQRLCKLLVIITLFLTVTGTQASAVLLSLQPGTPEACVPQTTNNLNTEWVGYTELNGKILDFISVRLAEKDGQLRLIEVPADKPNQFLHLQRFVPGLFETMVDWTEKKTSSRRVSEARP